MKRFIFIICLSLWSLSLVLPTTILADQASSGQNADYEVVYWETVKDSNDIEMYRAYIKRYPNGNFVDLARIKIKNLEQSASTVSDTNEQQEKSAAVPSVPKVVLTSVPRKLEERDIRAEIQKYNFCDQKRNRGGDFQNAFVDNGDDTVTDQATGLIWQKRGSWRKKVMPDAKRYIEDLNWQKLGGHTNWRLPTVEELASLLECRYSNRDWLFIDPIFGDAGGDWIDTCWTADRESLSSGWVVNFRKGTIGKGRLIPSSGGYPSSRKEFNYIRAVCSMK